MYYYNYISTTDNMYNIATFNIGGLRRQDKLDGLKRLCHDNDLDIIFIPPLRVTEGDIAKGSVRLSVAGS